MLRDIKEGLKQIGELLAVGYMAQIALGAKGKTGVIYLEFDAAYCLVFHMYLDKFAGTCAKEALRARRKLNLNFMLGPVDEERGPAFQASHPPFLG